MAAFKCPPVVHVVSTFMVILLSPIALAQSTVRTPQPLVKLNVLVTDKSNRLVMDLNQEDFLVRDEGKQQDLSFFQKKDIPVSYGLIVDSTGSMRSNAREAIQVAKAIVSSNRPEDRTFILRLKAGKVLLAQDWTSDKTALLNSLSIMKNDNAGMMSLIDSVYACSEVFTEQVITEDLANRRRVIVLITDGIEKEGSKKMDELLSRLHKENIQVFAVGMGSPKDARGQAAEFLKTLTGKTGGRSFYVETRPIYLETIEELKASAELIASYLRSQYVIGYSPGLDAKNNSLPDVPLSFAILIDVSRSQENTLPRVKSAASSFIGSVIRPNSDNGSIVSFGSQPKVEQSPTGDAAQLHRAINQLRTIPRTSAAGLDQTSPGTTSLYDSIWYTCENVLANAGKTTRRTILLITDGVDTSSHKSIRDAINQAVKFNVAVYSIGIGIREQSPLGEGGRFALREISEKTGGKAFFPRNPSELTEAFSQIGAEFQNQHLMSFQQAGKKQAGTYRKVKVEIVKPEMKKQDLKLAYRQGYFQE